MTRLFLYLLFFGVLVYLFSRLNQRQTFPKPSESSLPKPSRWFRSKRNPMEPWVQVYETASMDEARVVQARLQEEEVECVLYEQGKKDIHGNPLKGIGIAVPKTSMTLAQTLINRILS